MSVPKMPVRMCESLNVSRSAYYAWRQDGVSARQRDDHRLRPMIRGVFREHRRRYGARRIAVELTARDEPCGRRRVGRLMHEMGLVAIQPKSFKPRTTDSRHALGYSPNLLLDAPPPDGINQLWVGDISYVPLFGGEFLYLAMLMDRFSRRIVGWDLQDHMRESLVLAALRAAIALRQDALRASRFGSRLLAHDDSLWVFNHKTVATSVDPNGTECGACHTRTYCENCHNTKAVQIPQPLTRL